MAPVDTINGKLIQFEYAFPGRSTEGSLKDNFTFYTPMHPARLRCESSEYPDIPAFSRLAGRAS
jgi:hypothetical protein